MTTQVVAALRTIVARLRPSRSLTVLAVELAGLAAVVYGIHMWSAPASFVAGGVGLVLEAYALERR